MLGASASGNTDYADFADYTDLDLILEEGVVATHSRAHWDGLRQRQAGVVHSAKRPIAVSRRMPATIKSDSV